MEPKKKSWKLTTDEKRDIFERSALGESPSHIKENYAQVSFQAVSQLILTNKKRIKGIREKLIEDIPLTDRRIRMLLRQKRYYRLEQLIESGNNKLAFVELEKLQSDELRKIAEEMGLKTGAHVNVQTNVQQVVNQYDKLSDRELLKKAREEGIDLPASVEKRLKEGDSKA